MRMTRSVFVAALLSAVLAGEAQADFRLDNGRVLIQIGDPVARIHHHLKPIKRYIGQVCAKPSVMSCRRKGRTTGWIYQYAANDVIYTVQTHGGTITYIEWDY